MRKSWNHIGRPPQAFEAKHSFLTKPGKKEAQQGEVLGAVTQPLAVQQGLESGFLGSRI